MYRWNWTFSFRRYPRPSGLGSKMLWPAASVDTQTEGSVRLVGGKLAGGGGRQANHTASAPCNMEQSGRDESPFFRGWEEETYGGGGGPTGDCPS